MSSAICFNLNQSKILSSGNGLNVVRGFNNTTLTLYQTNPGFDDTEKRALLKTLYEKEEIMISKHFSSFYIMFCTL